MFGFLGKLLGRRGTQTPFCSAVVPAAGASSRMEGENKLLASLGGGPVLGRTVAALAQSELIGEIVVAAREEELLTVADICRAYVTGKPSKWSGAERRAWTRCWPAWLSVTSGRS